ncbi:lipid droplet-regulating VLDL assembly factor AUP1-like [Ylistrum balloti]|uniref:lipid droplet-regulating VLDL assembly factor AUP1-like n=1 Tax=Ylistrum balloti TaxID=509963 RepID=UPI002905DB12|nr:lipid droplet-regulating VLDL assembly factor AUP1-like [Ylistrum balloti]
MHIRRLFDHTRFPDGSSVVLTTVFFPFGLALVIIRIFIMMHALLVSCILPKCQATSFILKSLFGVVGIQVMVQEDKRNKHPNKIKPKIVVANHVSYLDHMVIDLIQPSVAPDEVGFSSFYRWLFSYRDFGIAQGKERLEENIKKYLQDQNIPVLFLPEGTPTNGSGILKFRTFPFSLKVPVLPVSISYTRWPLTMPVSTIKSTRLSECFWILFYPYTIFKLRLLEPMEQEEKETTEVFGERVRKKIAVSLGVPATNYTAGDKVEYLKRLSADQVNQAQRIRQINLQSQRDNGTKESQTNGDNFVNTSPEIRKMAQQVKDVLPTASMPQIIRELETTKDVDAAITNILEGSTAEDTKKSDTKDTPKMEDIKTGICASQQKYKSNIFPRTAPDRQLSLDERKKLMIATARQRYKEKHGLL